MGLFTEKYNSPFDNEQSRKKIDDKITVSHIRPASHLSTRASLFLGYSLISLCLEYIFIGNAIWWPAVCAFVCILIWSVTLRFFMPRNLSVISFAFVMSLFVAVCELSYRIGLCASYSAAGFIPMAIGVMSLARFKDDDNDEFSRPAFGREVMLPFAISLACALFGTLVSYIFEKRYLFISLLAGIMFLILMCWALSKLGGKQLRATSKKLTEFWDIPSADIVELKRFLGARGAFAAVCLMCEAALYVLKIFTDAGIFRVAALPLSETIALILGAIVVYSSKHNFRRSEFGLRYFISEVSIAAAFFALMFLKNPGMPKILHLIIALLFVCGTDIVMTGLLSVIRRRLIFVSKSRYIDGLPFYLILISLVVMLAETCLYCIPGL